MKTLLMIALLAPIFAKAEDCKHQIFIDDVVLPWTESTQNFYSTIRIRRKKAKNSCRYWRVGISHGGEPSYNRKLYQGTESLSYNFYKSSSSGTMIRRFPDSTGSTQYYDVYLANKDTYIDLYTRLPFPNNGSSFFKKGQYSDTIYVEAVPVSSGVDTITKSFSVSTEVPPKIDISLVDSVQDSFDIGDTSQTLDFGELQQGDQDDFALKVQSNAGYSISFSSFNNGKFKHNSENFYIDYNLKVNGVTKDLSSSSSTPVEVATKSGMTPLGGDDLEVSVTIGNTNNKLEGVYNDYITITAMSTD